LINCAGFIGRPTVDACEQAKAETIEGNILLPLTIAHACLSARIPWGHVSTGCIYSGAKICREERCVVERDLIRPEIKRILETAPESIAGFTEEDRPNFSFRAPPSSFYSGTKAVAEEALAGLGEVYFWRMRMPFDELDHPRNYLSKLQRYSKVYDNVNSLSHRQDFARACLDLWDKRAAPGIYNVTNPGWVTTRQVVELIRKHLRTDRSFEFWSSDAEFYAQAAQTPRSNCVLDVSKLLKTGVRMPPVVEALERSLKHWTAASQ
ncbi:MAG: sugar nucleotide-binding protein, partial [Verrucomicrobiota bacterium]